MSNFVIQNWPENQLKTLIDSIAQKNIYGIIDSVRACGSRVNGLFTENSDLDIVIYTPCIENHVTFFDKKTKFKNINIRIKFFPSIWLPKKLYLDKYDLPEFDLLTRKYDPVKSEYLQAFIKWRQNIRKKRLDRLANRKN